MHNAHGNTNAISRGPLLAGRALLLATNFLVCGFLIAPILVVVVVSFSVDQYMQFPPSGWSFRWYLDFFNDRRLLNGLWLSLWLALFTAVIAGLLGTLAAFALTKLRWALTDAVQWLHMSPLITPGVVTGLAMLIYFSALGMRGSFVTLLAGHVVLAIPFVVMIVVSGLKSYDRTLEEAAISLGANRVVAFVTVTLPVIKTSVISAAAFAFLHSLDEVVVTLFLPGPRTRTLPVAMFEHIQNNLDPLPAAVSTVLIAASVIVVLAAARFGTLSKFIGDN